MSWTSESITRSQKYTASRQQLKVSRQRYHGMSRILKSITRLRLTTNIETLWQTYTIWVELIPRSWQIDMGSSVEPSSNTQCWSCLVHGDFQDGNVRTKYTSFDIMNRGRTVCWSPVQIFEMHNAWSHDRKCNLYERWWYSHQSITLILKAKMLHDYCFRRYSMFWFCVDLIRSRNSHEMDSSVWLTCRQYCQMNRRGDILHHPQRL